jgi:c-di-GMP-binding flagellar brake protein YcgR
MSSESARDRRQTPRVSLGGEIECRLDLRTRVRLIDISLGGALLAAELALPVGGAAQLRAGLGASAFYSDVQVKRNVGLQAGTPMQGFGTAFTKMDERSRRSLEDFLRKASE